MRDFIHGLRDDAAERPRTLIAARGRVWMWPGIALSEQRGDEIVPVSPEIIRLWITRLHGPEALDTEMVHFVNEAARQLTYGNEVAAQRALDCIELSHLSRDGAALMHAVAKRLGVEAFDMPLRPGPRRWSARDIELLGRERLPNRGRASRTNGKSKTVASLRSSPTIALSHFWRWRPEMPFFIPLELSRHSHDNPHAY